MKGRLQEKSDSKEATFRSQMAGSDESQRGAEGNARGKYQTRFAAINGGAYREIVMNGRELKCSAKDRVVPE